MLLLQLGFILVGFSKTIEPQHQRIPYGSSPARAKSFITALAEQMDYRFDTEVYADIRSVLKKHLIDVFEHLTLNISHACRARTLELLKAAEASQAWALRGRHQTFPSGFNIDKLTKLNQDLMIQIIN